MIRTVSIRGLGVPVDVIVVTPEDVEAYRNEVGTIIAPALLEGMEVYAAAPRDGSSGVVAPSPR